MTKWYATQGCKGHNVVCGVEMPMLDERGKEGRKKRREEWPEF